MYQKERHMPAYTEARRINKAAALSSETQDAPLNYYAARSAAEWSIS